VGAVEKDSAVLAAEHKSLFETANAHEKAKKVCFFVLLYCFWYFVAIYFLC